MHYAGRIVAGAAIGCVIGIFIGIRFFSVRAIIGRTIGTALRNSH
ncbi:hypothetical protein [Nocardia sp. NBC_01009]|nr:hypothetical protein OHA42_19495 [Nocardia sp. NBC_01009]